MKLKTELSFVGKLSEANPFKKTANLAMHILYASPLKTEIIKESPIKQYAVKELWSLANISNHQNALVAVTYALSTFSNNSFRDTELKNVFVSYHYFVDLISVLCKIKICEGKYDNLFKPASWLSLIFEQIVYKKHPNLEYKEGFQF